MKTRKTISAAAFVLLFIAVMMFFAYPAGALAIYEPSEIKAVRAYYVNDLGRIRGQFTAGTLQKGDFAFLRLPEDFIWTTAGINCDQTVAAAAYQTTEDWNTIEAAPGYVKYGTGNFIRVPAQCSGYDNGLYKGTTPVLRFTRQSDNEVLMEVAEDLDPTLECCLDINATRVYVDKGAGEYVSLTIDAPAGSGFDSDAGFYNRLVSMDIPPVFAGVPGQKIGTLVIHEAEAGRLKEGQILVLELPAGAKWGKLAADRGDNLAVSGSVSDGGRTAKFRFSGESVTATVLELKGMEVVLEPGPTGWLKVKVSGSAGLAGELTVAKITNPAAVFTIGRAQYEINGVNDTMDAPPYIKSDRLYLPVRYIARAAGVTDDNITWDQDEMNIAITKDDRTIRLVIGSETMYVDGGPVLMDAAPEIAGPGRAMLPLRWIAEALGSVIYWDEPTGQVKVLD